MAELETDQNTEGLGEVLAKVSQGDDAGKEKRGGRGRERRLSVVGDGHLRQTY